MTGWNLDLGDHVRIRETPETADTGFAGMTGMVYGITTPSVTGIEVIGGAPADTAVGVGFESVDMTVWFDPDLVEFIDHGAGTTASAAGQDLVRTAEGAWKPVDRTPWWRRARK